MHQLYAPGDAASLVTWLGLDTFCRSIFRRVFFAKNPKRKPLVTLSIFGFFWILSDEFDENR